MRHIRLIKNVAFAAATTTIAATPMVIASCSCHAPEQPTLAKIDLELAQSKLQVIEGETQTFDAPTITCYDNNGNVMEQETKLILKTNDDLNPPEWIKLNESNQIIITGQQPGTKSFHLIAQDLEGKITSEIKNLDVQFNPAPKVAPDQIIINYEPNLPTFFIADNTEIKLNISAYKTGYKEDQLSKDCTWSIVQWSGEKEEDEQGNPLFQIEPTEEDCTLSISPYTNDEYIGSYNLLVEAVSKLNPNATSTVSVWIDLVDGKHYEDAFGLSYSRENVDDEWSLIKVPSDFTDFSVIMGYIYNKSVTKIGDNFCENSQITSLNELTLPSWIKKIGKKAFDSQYSLTKISIPSVQEIGDYAFANCFSAQFVDGGEPIMTEVGSYAFFQATKIKFNLTQSLKHIGSYAFAYTDMTSMDLGNQVVSMQSCIFEHCTYLSCFKISSINPPELTGSVYRSKTPLKAIIVPLESVEKYRQDQMWQAYGGIISGI